MIRALPAEVKTLIQEFARRPPHPLALIFHDHLEEIEISLDPLNSGDTRWVAPRDWTLGFWVL